MLLRENQTSCDYREARFPISWCVPGRLRLSLILGLLDAPKDPAPPVWLQDGFR